MAKQRRLSAREKLTNRGDHLTVAGQFLNYELLADKEGGALDRVFRAAG